MGLMHNLKFHQIHGSTLFVHYCTIRHRILLMDIQMYQVHVDLNSCDLAYFRVCGPKCSYLISADFGIKLIVPLPKTTMDLLTESRFYLNVQTIFDPPALLYALTVMYILLFSGSSDVKLTAVATSVRWISRGARTSLPPLVIPAHQT